ncbi:hypothetical protein IscW_ISCW008064 [Ixodes scapularis]|uniref:Uncharacterized protein n=1 Tax=Ixodes scapularis TaxID=6945 RepID=B7PSQ1_IXOSC|nr:hypothetical protein IscW_ISCW008064 [Ixodes scapularis]|eukprot:XP_002402811.1 hypothetical protein IscW_ISCW008064 [Ixodes scapularis]
MYCQTNRAFSGNQLFPSIFMKAHRSKMIEFFATLLTPGQYHSSADKDLSHTNDTADIPRHFGINPPQQRRECMRLRFSNNKHGMFTNGTLSCAVIEKQQKIYYYGPFVRLRAM